MRELEVQFYENGRGGVAISVDGGEHVIIANGRRLLLADTTWEDSDENWEALTEPQRAAVEEAKVQLAGLNEAQSDLDEIVFKYRKRRLREAQRSPTRAPEKPTRELPETVMIEYSDIIND